MGRIAIPRLNHPIHPELRIAPDEEMDVIGDDGHFHEGCLEFLHFGGRNSLSRVSTPLTNTFRLTLGQNTTGLLTDNRDIAMTVLCRSLGQSRVKGCTSDTPARA